MCFFNGKKIPCESRQNVILECAVNLELLTWFASQDDPTHTLYSGACPINAFITCFTKYSNNLLSYPVRYCSCCRTHIGLLVHRYRTARAPISARSRSSIKMAERPIKPQAFNTLTSFYKNLSPKTVKNCV